MAHARVDLSKDRSRDTFLVQKPGNEVLNQDRNNEQFE